ncbi:MAG: hypothetical protein NTW25_12505 [Candidatus Kapabacteria bacterium]|nr:hypothetical protein [Candidatus Kapabacteria bacterium]
MKKLIKLIIFLFLISSNLYSKDSTSNKDSDIRNEYHFDLNNISNFNYRNIQKKVIYLNTNNSCIYSPDKKFYVYSKFNLRKNTSYVAIYNYKGRILHKFNSPFEFKFFWNNNFLIAINNRVQKLFRFNLKKIKQIKETSYDDFIEYLGQNDDELFFKSSSENAIYKYKININGIQKIKFENLIDTNQIDLNIYKNLRYYDGKLLLFTALKFSNKHNLYSNYTSLSQINNLIDEFYKLTKNKYNGFIGLVGNKLFGSNNDVRTFNYNSYIKVNGNKKIMFTLDSFSLINVYNNDYEKIFEFSRRNMVSNTQKKYEFLPLHINDIEFISDDMILLVFDDKLPEMYNVSFKNKKLKSDISFIYFNIKTNKILENKVIIKNALGDLIDRGVY